MILRICGPLFAAKYSGVKGTVGSKDIAIIVAARFGILRVPVIHRVDLEERAQILINRAAVQLR